MTEETNKDPHAGKNAHGESSLNHRIQTECEHVREFVVRRSEQGLGIPPHTEAYRLVLVVRATSRDIEWDKVPNPLPSNPFDIDLEQLEELCTDAIEHAKALWFQHSPTNFLFADAMRHLGDELERHTDGKEPKTWSGRRDEREENHPLELKWVDERLNR